VKLGRDEFFINIARIRNMIYDLLPNEEYIQWVSPYSIRVFKSIGGDSFAIRMTYKENDESELIHTQKYWAMDALESSEEKSFLANRIKTMKKELEEYHDRSDKN